VPNDNYCKFEDWVNPILDQLLVEQKQDGELWTPSKVIDRLGKEIDDPDSCWYWAHKVGRPRKGSCLPCSIPKL
jgi:deoxyhypusine synthase